MPITQTVEDGVAFLALARPPVNSLNRVMRRDLLTSLQAAASDSQVGAIVLWGGPKLFCAGADIAEFAGGAQGDALADPTLAALVAAIECSPKPVIAAIAGPCMGGGFELALGCHVRLLDPSARIALPEIKLGLLPGAGGTQRLPRLIGVEAALRMILSGETLNAAKSAALGIGELSQGELRRAATERARSAAVQPVRRVSALTAQLPEGSDPATYFQTERIRLRSPTPAALQCLKAVEAATTMAFAAGMQVEQVCFAELMRTTEARALQYAFFGDRRASVIEGLPVETKPARVELLGVVGAGTMGSGIALCALNAGVPTLLVEPKSEVLEHAKTRIRASLDQAVAKGRLMPEERDSRWALLRTTDALEALAEADLIIEAVFEDLAVKSKVFHALDRIAKSSACLATNTSTLDVNLIAAATKRPASVVGLHFFSPAHVMRLLEVVRGANSSPATLATAFAVAKRLGKVPVLSQVCDGFIGNRMFEEYLRQAYFLLEIGASPWQIDSALERWGMAMGPFAVMDLAGGDIGWAIRKRRAIERPHEAYSEIPDRICALGRFGQKTGAGFYRYDEGGPRQPDPQIDALIEAYCREAGLMRRAVTDEEIVLRCILALVNEGARLLGEGIAQRASDMDVVYRNGYGFPAHRGGPIYYADEVGLPAVVKWMQEFRGGYRGEYWEIAPLIRQCAKSNVRLTDSQAGAAGL